MNDDFFYHLSNKEFKDIKDFGNGISLLLDCPDDSTVARLANAGFKPWEKIGGIKGQGANSYYVYEVDLNKESKNILEYRLTSLPEEFDYFLREDATREGKRKYLEEKGIINTFTSYKDFKKGLKDHWRNTAKYAKEQIKRCKTLKHKDIDPYEMYALFIPHVIITMKPGKDLKPATIYYRSPDTDIGNVGKGTIISKEEYDFSLSTEASKNPKRAAVESLILKYIDKIVTGKENTKLYQDLFASMNDKQFDEFMHKLKNKQATLSIIVPNGDNRFKVTVENNIKLGKELGYEFFQHLNFSKTENKPAYKTPNKFMVIKLPVRRAAQLLTKKISIPSDAQHIDALTGQVTGSSAGAKLTNPELQVLLGLGLKDSLKEMVKLRGGDLGAGRAMDLMLFKHGSASQQQATQYESGVVSKKTLRAYFMAMGIDNTL